MVSVWVLPKPKSFGFYQNPFSTETQTETQVFMNFCSLSINMKGKLSPSDTRNTDKTLKLRSIYGQTFFEVMLVSL